MTTRIYWDTGNKPDRKEVNILASVAAELDSMIEKFPFLYSKAFPDPMELNIIMVDDLKIRELNTNFREKNESTDVLTFPFSSAPPHPGEINTAEIYISVDTALRQSLGQKLTLIDELIILTIHGFLHAFDYDHERSEKCSLEMKQHEQEILNAIGSDKLIPLTN
ncbi:MAG: rRNA maturation RNase YbeY [Spirochaetia bacterium]|nr:rRNA maturation RNase YbeY [Spirochaetia bacterium]